MTVQFTDPPPKGGIKWEPVVAALKARPGKWALVFEAARISIPNAIRNQSIRDLRKDAGFEIRTSNESRATGARTADVYLRYNPNNDSGLSGHERRSAIAEFNKNTEE